MKIKEESDMRSMMIGLFVVAAMAGNAMSADVMTKKVEKLVKSVQDGCSAELTSYCKDVTEGNGQKLACLYAYQDKLSTKCEYALYDAAAQLQQAIVKVAYVANECSSDLEKYCSGVEVGGGRVLDCMKKNESKLTSRCSEAIKETTSK
jgi:hypothetical protein